GPRSGEELFERRPEDGVLVPGPVLEAGHRSPLVVEANLPEARVAAEDRRVAAAGGEGVDRVAHAPGPVLVVTDGQEQSVAVQDLGALLEVLADREVEPVAV